MVRSERTCKRERAWTRPVIPPGYIVEILLRGELCLRFRLVREQERTWFFV